MTIANKPSLQNVTVSNVQVMNFLQVGNATAPASSKRMYIEYGVTDLEERADEGGAVLQLVRWTDTAQTPGRAAWFEFISDGGSLTHDGIAMSAEAHWLSGDVPTRIPRAIDGRIFAHGSGNSTLVMAVSNIRGVTTSSDYGSPFTGTISAMVGHSVRVCESLPTGAIKTAWVVHVNQPHGYCTITDEIVGLMVNAIWPNGAPLATGIKIAAQPNDGRAMWIASNQASEAGGIVWGTARDTRIWRGRAGALTMGSGEDLYTTGYLCAGTGCTSSAPSASAQGVYDSGNRVVSSCSAGSGISSCTVTDGVLSVSAAASPGPATPYVGISSIEFTGATGACNGVTEPYVYTKVGGAPRMFVGLTTGSGDCDGGGALFATLGFGVLCPTDSVWTCMVQPTTAGGLGLYAEINFVADPPIVEIRTATELAPLTDYGMLLDCKCMQVTPLLKPKKLVHNV